MKSTKKKKSLKNKKSLFPFPELPPCSYRILCVVLFALLTYYFTVFYNYDFLLWAEELSLFIPGKLFFVEQVQMPGGLLGYLGAFLTQLFYYPLLGSTVLILLLLVVQLLVVKIFAISAKYFPLSFVPAGMLVLAVIQMEYVLHSLKAPGYLFSGVLGTILFLLFFMMYRKIKSRPASVLLILLYTFTYPLFGFYALFTVFFCIIYEILSFTKDKNTQRFFSVVTGVFFMLVIPYVVYIYTNTGTQFNYIYIAALPGFHFTQAEFILWLPFIILFLSFFFSFCFFLPSGNR